MFKKTKELKNINPQHLFLFKLENLLGRVKNKILNGETEITKNDRDVQDIVELSKTVPTLSFKDWHANYREGVDTKQIQTEIDQIKPVYQQNSVINYFTFKENELLRLLYNTHKQGKNSPIYNDQKLMNQFFDTVQIHMSSLLNDQEKQLENKNYPTLLMRMSMMFNKGMIPRNFFDDDNYNLFMKLKDYISDYNELDEYSFIFPLDPEKVPKEIRNQTTEKDVKDKNAIKKMKKAATDIVEKIKDNEKVSADEINKLFDMLEELLPRLKDKVSAVFKELETSPQKIAEYFAASTSKEGQSTGEKIEKSLLELEELVYNNKDVPKDKFANFIKLISDAPSDKEVKPFEIRINKLFDHLEGK